MSDGEIGAAAVEVAESAQAKETDWVAEARKWESRAKENKSALTAKDAELLTFKDKATTLEARVAELEAAASEVEKQNALKALVAEVAKESGVPADVLRGSTREELEAHAETLKSLIKPAGPVVSGAGDTPGAGGDDAEREFIRELFGRND